MCADANEPGLLYAPLTKGFRYELCARSPRSTGHTGMSAFRANDGKPLSWAVSIKSPLKDPLINGFEDIDNVSAYDQWVAVLEQIELARTVAGVEPADRSYPAILDSNVAVITGCAGPVDDHTVLDDPVDLGIRYSSVTRLQHYPDPSAKVT